MVSKIIKKHRILVVDDDIHIEKIIGRILDTIGVDMVYAADGKEALEELINASMPFSMVISDQVMPGMKGHELLEKVRELSPNTIRFILTGYTELKIIIHAVNQGAIHRYLVKPCDPVFLSEEIRKGLEDYEFILENDHLLTLAKEQNRKLYKFYQSLVKKTADHKNEIQNLDADIRMLGEKIEAIKNRTPEYEDNIQKKLAHMLDKAGVMNEQGASLLLEECVFELHEQFSEIAARNNVEFKH